MGDSRTSQPPGYTGVTGWQAQLAASLLVSAGTAWTYAVDAVGGQTMVNALENLNTQLTIDPIPANAVVTDILLNWGVNDSGIPWIGLPGGYETWTGYWVQLFDELHARFPRSRIFVARPWSAGGSDLHFDYQATAIANAVAQRPTFAFLGPDERVWLKGADNGATMTTDGTHYSVAGFAEAAAQWQTTLGY